MAVSAEQVRIELGLASLTDERTAQINAWIEQVQTLISGRAPLESLDATRLDFVLLAIVTAYAQQPSPGVVAKEVGVDDARTVNRYSPGRKSLLDLLDDWWAYLLDIPSRPRGAFTIRPAYQSDMGRRRDWR